MPMRRDHVSELINLRVDVAAAIATFDLELALLAPDLGRLQDAATAAHRAILKLRARLDELDDEARRLARAERSKPPH